MKNWLNNCRIRVIFLAAVLLLSMAMPVQAASPETGTLKILLKEKDCQVEFLIYKVAGYENGSYIMCPEFAMINDGLDNPGEIIDVNHMRDAKEQERCAEALVGWTKTQRMEPLYQKTTINGEWNLGEVSLGMYLIAQMKQEDDQLRVLPFLVGVPYWKIVTEGDEEKLVPEYQVEATPKGEKIVPHPPKPEPPEPEKPKPPKPTPPGESENAKTGDETAQWTVFYLVLMAVSGSVAFALEKRRQDKRKIE